MILRMYNGALYTRALENRAGSKKWETITGLRHRPRRLPVRCCIKDNREEGVAYAKKEASAFIIINGREVWVKTGEPRYEIATFGLGGNHTETALMISTRYNDNVSAGRYFTALQRKEAVAEAIRVALARGNTNSVPRIKRAWKINVHIPEAVKCDPQKEAGPGDPFLNQLEDITTVKDPLAAGLLAIGLLSKEL